MVVSKVFKFVIFTQMDYGGGGGFFLACEDLGKDLTIILCLCFKFFFFFKG